MKKQTIHISDAIPTPPASFDQAVENALHSVTQQQTGAVRRLERRPIRFSKKAWIAIAVAAALLVTTTAVAAAAIVRREHVTPVEYMMQTKEEREQLDQTIPDVENAIASAKPENGAYEIIMLPDMENADERNAYRLEKGQPAYSEEDWGWIREIRPEVEEVLFDGNTLVFNIRLKTDHGMSFSWDLSGEGQHVDALCDDAYYTVQSNGQTRVLSGLGTGTIPNSVTEDGVTLTTNSSPRDLSTEGLVLITAEIGIRDVDVEDMGNIGLLAKILYTFTFDASAGADIADPVVTERPLSGSAVLSMFDDNGNYFNERISLDGVILEETVSYRNTGVYVRYKIKSAPDGWTEAQSKALLQSSNVTADLPGMWVACTPKAGEDANEIMNPGIPESPRSDECLFILPIFPSDYEQARETGYELRLVMRSVDSFNGESVGEDWRTPDRDSTAEYEYTAQREQTLGTFELPLP